MRFRVIAILAGVAALAAPAIAQDRTAAAEKILPTLALVIVPQTNDQASVGTAFCFWSTASKSYFLTNKHVIEGGSQVLLQLQALSGSTLLKARVYPRPSIDLGEDLAILVVDAGNIPYVIFQEYMQPKAGQAIGIFGYPSFRFEPPNNAKSVSPSVHFGSVNSVPYSNFNYLEFDAVADHGNSGGPLFDARTGYVYGVVTLGIPSKTSAAVQNNLALANPGAFIFSAYLPHAKYAAQYGVSAEIPCLGGTSQYVLARERGWCALPDAVTTK